MPGRAHSPLPMLVAGMLLLVGAQAGRADTQAFMTADGLGSNTISLIAEDRAGFIWVEAGGLMRYDGFTWKAFGKADGLASNAISGLLADRAGGLWAGTDDSLSYYDGSSWSTLALPNGLTKRNLRPLIEDSKGNTWFASDRGPVRLDSLRKAWDFVADRVGLLAGSTNAMIEDRQGNLWFSQLNDVVRLDPTSGVTQDLLGPDGMPLFDVRAILEDSSGRIWFGANRYDPASSSWAPVRLPRDFGSPPVVMGIGEDRLGRIWIAGGALFRYEGHAWRRFDTVMDRPPLCFLLDSSGFAWEGGFGADQPGGLYRMDGSEFRTLLYVSNYNEEGASAPRGLWLNIVFEGVPSIQWSDGSSWHALSPPGAPGDLRAGTVVEDRAHGLWLATTPAVYRLDLVDSTWTSFTTADGLPETYSEQAIVDHAGDVWLDVVQGILRYDSKGPAKGWWHYTRETGLASDSVSTMFEDHTGALWFGMETGAATRLDPDRKTWTSYPARSVPGAFRRPIEFIYEARSGELWFGAADGVTVYNPADQSWGSPRPPGDVSLNGVLTMMQDASGALWFGTSHGAVRYGDGSWKTYGTPEGLPGPNVTGIFQDFDGNLWFSAYETYSKEGRQEGITRFDGQAWRTFPIFSGYHEQAPIIHFAQSSRGELWLLPVNPPNYYPVLYTEDRLAPHVLVQSRPVPLSTSRVQSASVRSVYREPPGVVFSFSLDGAAWTPWSDAGAWVGHDLADGRHDLRIAARDWAQNVDSISRAVTFEVDGTPPRPIIRAPAFGAAVHDSFVVVGDAGDTRFHDYQVSLRGLEDPGARDTLRARFLTPVVDGALAKFDTRGVPDGRYELSLAVTDTLGLTGIAAIECVVDNQAPSAGLTSPALVSSTNGGDVFTTNREAHLYFPPHAFSDPALVTVAPVADSLLAPSPPPGMILASRVYDVGWGDARLLKPARLELSYAGAPPASSGNHAEIFTLGPGDVWRRLGGTDDAARRLVAAPLVGPARLGLFFTSGAAVAVGGLSSLSTIPRVFSPSGRFASADVGISFTLGRPGPVSVKVFNRAGRLVRWVLADQSLGAGANLVRWDGRDRDGRSVDGGLYIVTVEALGTTLTQPLAVVR